MKKIKFLIFTICVLNISILLSQSRENRKKFTFTGRSQKISNSTGWSYNKEIGEWVDYKNVILNNKEYKDMDKSIFIPRVGKTEQNFKSIDFRTISFRGVKYYILMIQKSGGWYIYPNIRKDWISRDLYLGHIFSENEFKKLLSLENEVELITTGPIRLGRIYDYEETKFLDLIQTRLTTDESEFYMGENWERKFPVKKTKSDGSEVIRLLLPSLSCDFENNYFEISPKDFKKLLDIK
jgi:hypothetical protein